MKAIVIDKKHLTLVSHTNGVTIVEASGCIIDLDFQSLGSIFELANFGNTYTIKDFDEIESLKSNNNELTERIQFLEEQLVNSDNRITELRNEINGITNELNIRGQRIAQLNDKIDTLKADSYKENEKYNELYNRNECLEKKLAISCEAVTNLESSNETFKSNIVEKNNTIKSQSDEIARLSKIIEKKTNSLIELANVEYELDKYRETNNALTKKLESKTSDLAERTYWFRYYRQAFRAVKEYLKPDEKYGFDSSGYNITNSIDSKFVISFKDRSIASRAFNELRYSVSPRNVLSKYANDIIEYNVDAMNIYFIEGTTPAVVRKFNNENFTITCKDRRTANTINTLLNCSNILVYDIVDRFKDEIACSSVY